MPEKRLLELFETINLPYTLRHHKPVFTAEDGADLCKEIPGAHSKNLFLTNKKGSFFLVSVPHHKRVHIRGLGKVIGEKELSFGTPEDMQALLGVQPGSVTPYALINDGRGAVRFILDEELTQAEQVNFHPLRNDMNIGMAIADFLRFFEIIQRKIEILSIPARQE